MKIMFNSIQEGMKNHMADIIQSYEFASVIIDGHKSGAICLPSVKGYLFNMIIVDWEIEGSLDIRQ